MKSKDVKVVTVLHIKLKTVSTYRTGGNWGNVTLKVVLGTSVNSILVSKNWWSKKRGELVSTQIVGFKMMGRSSSGRWCSGCVGPISDIKHMFLYITSTLTKLLRLKWECKKLIIYFSFWKQDFHVYIIILLTFCLCLKRGTCGLSNLCLNILQAALPQSITSFIFAKEYGLHADVLSTA